MTTRKLFLLSIFTCVVLLSCWLVLGQAPCPDVKQDSAKINGQDVKNLGMAQDANVTVEVVNDKDGTWTADQVAQVGQVATSVKDQPGNTGSVTTTTPATGQDPSAGSVSNPVAVVQMATQDAINTACHVPSGSNVSACTSWQIRQSSSNSSVGNIYYSVTLILPSVVASGGLQPLMAHEFSHGIMGVADCNGCANTIANPDTSPSSPTAPTPCDNETSKKNWCRCNFKK
jgi:hypothetical protein